jgi:plasmid stabilization system protein ParE
VARTVEIDSKADADLRAIARSIATRVSRDSALRWSAKLRMAIHSLALKAEQYPEADEAKELNIDLRMMLIGNRSHVYRILFRIVENVVIVYRIRHAAQDQITEEDL